MSAPAPFIELPISHYFGGKGASGTYQKIINQIPPHKVFISGFLGHCAIMRYKTPAQINIGFDKDLKIIQTWQNASFQNDISHKDIVLFNDDFLEQSLGLTSSFGKADDVFIYLDPPYLLSSRKYQKPTYKYELSVENHKKLLELVLNLPFKIAISCYPNELYGSILKDWRYIQFESSTRQGLATEMLYMNYDSPTELHDYRFYGETFRERELIKKRFKNITKKIEMLPVIERGNVF